MRIAACLLIFTGLTCVGHSLALSNLVLDKTSYVGGGDAIEGVVILDGNAPAGGTVVTLADTTGSVTTPATVTVLAGTNSATFTCSTAAVTAPATRTISANLGAITKVAPFAITPISRPLSISLFPNEVEAGAGSVFITVVLDYPMANSGAMMSVTDNSSAITIDHPEIFVSRGAVAVTGNSASTTAVGTTATRQITASCNGISRTADLILRPRPTIVSLSASDQILLGGAPFNLFITITGFIKQGGNSVSLSCPSPAIDIDASAFFLGTYGISPVNTNPVATTQTAIITASLNGTSRSCTVVIRP